MFIGLNIPIPNISNLPGPSRPGYPSGSDERLITVWRTTTSNEDVIIPFQNQSHNNTTIQTAVNLDVDWGDGNSESYQATTVNNAYLQHTYATAGDHKVKITGRCSGLYMGGTQGGNDATNRNRLIEVKNWGDTKITGLNYMLSYCNNVVVTATDSPTRLPLGEDAGAVFYTQARRMFFNCNSITSLDISMWDPSLWDQINYAYEMCAYLINCESLKLPSGITAAIGNMMYCFLYLGNSTTDGCTLEWNNLTNANASFQVPYLLNAAKLKGTSKLNNWVVNNITSTNYTLNTVESTDTNSKIELKDWSTTGNGFTNMTNFLRSSKIHYLDISGWNRNMTENVASWAYFMYSTGKLKEIKGLNSLCFNGSTSFVYFIFNAVDFKFGAPGSDTNFASDSFDNPSNTGVSCGNAFSGTGSNIINTGGDYTDAYPPNVSNWDVSGINNMASMFYGCQFNAGVDISNWDLSGITNVNSMFYAFCNNSRPTTITTQFNNISSNCTSFVNCWRASAVTNAIFNSNCDLSGVTSFSHSLYYPNNWRGNIFSLVFDSNVDFSGLGSGGFQTCDGANVDGAEYDLMINRFWATATNTGVTIRMNLANFNGDLTFPDTLTQSMSTWTTADKVIDTNKDFVALGVQVNDIVYTKSGGTYQYSKVTNVAATELTLADSIVSSSFRYYNVGGSDSMKNKYNLISQRSWVFNDGGPVIS
jgi:hypothetical protein|tara:strand:- start:556 stop:2667 length:2112 start_codon:yes stop_codon:yes gene_type:complete